MRIKDLEARLLTAVYYILLPSSCCLPLLPVGTYDPLYCLGTYCLLYLLLL